MSNKGNKFEIKLKAPFSLDKTLKSEQCAADLWFFNDSQNYWISYLPIQGYWIKIMLRQTQNIIEGEYLPEEYNVEEELLEKLYYIFRFKENSGEVLSTFSQKDAYLTKVIANCKGIRIMRDLNREYRLLETIITQNTSVKMIKIMQRLLFLNFGDKIQLKGENIFTYPRIEKIANAEILDLKMKCKLGYRTEYLKNVAQQILSGKLSLENLAKMPINQAKRYLMSFKGIGRKISDLILMYGFEKGDVFPLDVWVKKAVRREYFDGRNVSEKEIYEWAIKYFRQYAPLFNLMIFLYERGDKSEYFNYCVWR